MSDLAHGLAPKMRPISPRRSAIVCALDIGTSKIVCLIARLKPQHCGIDIRSWEKNSCRNGAQIFHAMMQLDAQRQRPVIMRAR